MKLFFDNKVDISINNNPIQHNRTKHVETELQFIKERMDNCSIYIPYISSNQQIVDIHPKRLLR